MVWFYTISEALGFQPCDSIIDFGTSCASETRGQLQAGSCLILVNASGRITVSGSPGLFNTGRSVHWLCSDTGHVHWVYSDTGHVRESFGHIIYIRPVLVIQSF